MSAVAVAIVVSGAVAYYASEKAGERQEATAQRGITEERRQFDKVQELLSPYVEAGEGALEAQQVLLGLSGPEEQEKAINALLASPQFQAYTQTGEQGILQNVAATGGLRGGDVQSTLAQFRPQVLSQMIQERFANLGSISRLGQASAAGVGAAAQETGRGISDLLAQIGAAQAGAEKGKGQAISDTTTGLAGYYAGSSF